MKFHPDIPVYGDVSFRGKCPAETVEQVTFFGELRRRWPDTLGRLALHPKNEEKRQGKDFTRLDMDKAMGMSTGASDIILPGGPALIIEMKRQDHTLSKWQPGQKEYLLAAKEVGATVCVALGWEAAIEAVEEWLNARQ